ncbi:MAG: nicotinate (nicotinamide) nucleotide adenylyltransferase [Rikenellaceae bacterium]
MLYFGSFNPIHRGHIALAEYVVERELCDELVMVVSPQNPLKSSSELAPELERFTMAELACGASRFPDRIKPSLIEFMLSKPSYTINTLRHLRSEYGSQMEFSILMGGDIVEQLHRWRDYEEILADYPIYLYPRRGERVDRYLDKMQLLEDAPLFDISSTQIRTALMRGDDVRRMLCPEVVCHIKDQGLWSSDSYADVLARRIEESPNDTNIYMERGTWHYRNERWGEALNDFNRVLRIDPLHAEAMAMTKITREIVEFRHTDIYNP